MPTANIVVLVGHLGADPELRYTPNGKAVATMSLAVNDGWGDNQKTYWVRVKVWGTSGEWAGKNLAKGNAVLVNGRLTIEKWEDKESGQEKQAVVIVANSCQRLTGASKRDPDEQYPDIPDSEIPF